MSNETTLRSRPGRPAQWFMRAPVLLYQLGLADQLAARGFLLLHTTGRRTGRHRVSAVSFTRDDTTLYVAAGWGERTGWYQNLLANPMVEVQIGHLRLAARARPVADPEEKMKAVALLGERDQGPPKALRPALRRLGFDYDAERARSFEHPERLTIVALELTERVEDEQREHGRRSLPLPLVSAAVFAALLIALALRSRRRPALAATGSARR